MRCTAVETAAYGREHGGWLAVCCILQFVSSKCTLFTDSMLAAGHTTLVPAGVVLVHHWTKLMHALPEESRLAGLAHFNSILTATGLPLIALGSDCSPT